MPELVEQVLERSGYLDALEAERTIEAQGRIENLQELVGVAREYQVRAEEPTPVTASSRRSRSTPTRTRCREEQSLVTLMTLHNAKGLEFRAVFMIGMEERHLPALAVDRGAGHRGGAAALLRRHDAREGACSRCCTRPLARSTGCAATTCRRGSSTSSRSGTSSAIGCDPRHGPATARRSR